MLAPPGPRHVLIVDRDLATVEPLRSGLTGAGLRVAAVADFESALGMLLTRPPHLIVLEWHQPGYTSMEIIERARSTRFPHQVRVIILSTLSNENDVINGLNLGADDYIAKPFSMAEAVARVFAVLRARPVVHRDLAELVAGASAPRFGYRSIEQRLLEFLVSHPGEVFNRSQLLVTVWGDQTGVDERTVDVNVRRLRRLLSTLVDAPEIQTVRGFGYKLVRCTSRN